MKSDTSSYVHLQNLYKARAREERDEFAQALKGVLDEINAPQQLRATTEELVDEFVRNTHGLKVMRGRQWGSEDDAALCKSSCSGVGCSF